MRPINLNDVQEVQDFKSVKPCGYVCEITNVEDVPNKEYLRIEFDIAAGQLKGYYRERYNNTGYWLGSFIKSYKDKALPFFKGFITAVERSNAGYSWDNDERKLIGKKVGLVIAEEEYINKNGETKVRNYVAFIHDTQKIMNNDFKVPELKKIKNDSAPSATADPAPAPFEAVPDAAVPF